MLLCAQPVCQEKGGPFAVSQGGEIYMPYPRGGKRKKESEREPFSYLFFSFLPHCSFRTTALGSRANLFFLIYAPHPPFWQWRESLGFPYVRIVVMVQYVRLFLPDFFPHHTQLSISPLSLIRIPPSPSPLLLLPSADPTPLRLQWQSSDERFMNHPSPTNQTRTKPYRLPPSPIPRFDCCRAEQQQMRGSLEAKKIS